MTKCVDATPVDGPAPVDSVPVDVLSPVRRLVLSARTKGSNQETETQTKTQTETEDANLTTL